MGFQGTDSIVLYKSKSDDELCQYEKFDTIKSNNLTNFVCFESGNIEYLAIGGKKTHLLRLSENEFQNNVEADLHLNGKSNSDSMITHDDLQLKCNFSFKRMDIHFADTTEISWITTVPLNTYRDESLLLIQFKNLSVIALAWQGLKFRTVVLPNQILNNFDLSKSIVIPKIGFIHANVFVRIDVVLSELAYPIYSKMESIIKTQALLEVFTFAFIFIVYNII